MPDNMVGDFYVKILFFTIKVIAQAILTRNAKEVDKAEKKFEAPGKLPEVNKCSW